MTNNLILTTFAFDNYSVSMQKVKIGKGHTIVYWTIFEMSSAITKKGSGEGRQMICETSARMLIKTHFKNSL